MRIEPSTARSKLKSNTLTDCAMGAIHGQVPAERRLKRECFLISVRHADFQRLPPARGGTAQKKNDLTTNLIMENNNFPAKVIRCSEWQHRHNLVSHNCAVYLDESLVKRNTNPWTAWICLNRSRTDVACRKKQRKRWT